MNTLRNNIHKKLLVIILSISFFMISYFIYSYNDEKQQTLTAYDDDLDKEWKKIGYFTLNTDSKITVSYYYFDLYDFLTQKKYDSDNFGVFEKGSYVIFYMDFYNDLPNGDYIRIKIVVNGVDYEKVSIKIPQFPNIGGKVIYKWNKLINIDQESPSQPGIPQAQGIDDDGYIESEQITWIWEPSVDLPYPDATADHVVSGIKDYEVNIVLDIDDATDDVVITDTYVTGNSFTHNINKDIKYSYCTAQCRVRARDNAGNYSEAAVKTLSYVNTYNRIKEGNKSRTDVNLDKEWKNAGLFTLNMNSKITVSYFYWDIIDSSYKKCGSDTFGTFEEGSVVECYMDLYGNIVDGDCIRARIKINGKNYDEVSSKIPQWPNTRGKAVFEWKKLTKIDQESPSVTGIPQAQGINEQGYVNTEQLAWIWEAAEDIPHPDPTPDHVVSGIRDYEVIIGYYPEGNPDEIIYKKKYIKGNTFAHDLPDWGVYTCTIKIRARDRAGNFGPEVNNEVIIKTDKSVENIRLTENPITIEQNKATLKWYKIPKGELGEDYVDFSGIRDYQVALTESAAEPAAEDIITIDASALHDLYQDELQYTFEDILSAQYLYYAWARAIDFADNTGNWTRTTGFSPRAEDSPFDISIEAFNNEAQGAGYITTFSDIEDVDAAFYVVERDSSVIIRMSKQDIQNNGFIIEDIIELDTVEPHTGVIYTFYTENASDQASEKYIQAMGLPNIAALFEITGPPDNAYFQQPFIRFDIEPKEDIEGDELKFRLKYSDEGIVYTSGDFEIDPLVYNFPSGEWEWWMEIAEYSDGVLVGTQDTASFSITIDVQRPVTEVSGIIDADTTWSGIIRMTGDVTVESGAELTILPDTWVIAASTEGDADDKIDLIIDGSLRIEAGAESVLFTTDIKAPYMWDGILIYGTAIIENTIIQFAERAITVANTTAVSIDGCILEHNLAGVHAFNSDPLINNTILRNNSIYGIKEDGDVSPQVTNCEFENNAIDYYDSVQMDLTMDELNAMEGNEDNIKTD